MATKLEVERLAVVEQQVKDLAKDISEVKDDVKEIKNTLDNLTGGKQALMWVTATLIALAALAIGAINVIKKG